MIDPESKELIAKLIVQMERLAAAVEKQNSLHEKLSKCPACLGDGKGYGGARCIPCGGTGTKQSK